MTYDQFESWLRNLSENDRKFLERRSDWKKDHQKAQKTRVLPQGFSEKTMEILEGGSESET